MTAHGVTVQAMVGLTITPTGPVDMALLARLGVGQGGMNLAICAPTTGTVQKAIAGGAQDEATPMGPVRIVLPSSGTVELSTLNALALSSKGRGMAARRRDDF